MASSDCITTYIGTYTRRESFVDGKAQGLYIYHLDLRSGQLTYAATVAGAGTINPSFLTVIQNLPICRERHLVSGSCFIENCPVAQDLHSLHRRDFPRNSR